MLSKTWLLLPSLSLCSFLRAQNPEQACCPQSTLCVCPAFSLCHLRPGLNSCTRKRVSREGPSSCEHHTFLQQVQQTSPTGCVPLLVQGLNEGQGPRAMCSVAPRHRVQPGQQQHEARTPYSWHQEEASFACCPPLAAESTGDVTVWGRARHSDAAQFMC